jgi:hypothetical protein
MEIKMQDNQKELDINHEVIKKDYPGYKTIPGFSRYIINPKGEIISLITDTKMKQHNYDGYSYVALQTDNSTKINQLVHRLLALTFIPVPEGYEAKDLQVHHKDEDKRNNIIDVNDLYGKSTNLQWVTPEEHIKLSIELGQHKVVPVKAYDRIANKVLTYASIKQAADMCNLSDTGLADYIGLNKTHLVKDRYQFKYLDDTTPWVTPTKPIKAPRRIRAYHVATCQETEYNSIQEAVDALGLTREVVLIRLNNIELMNSSVGGYIFKYIEDTNPWPSSNNITSRVANSPTPIKIKDLTTGKIHTYKDAVAAESDLGISTTMIYNRLKLPKLHNSPIDNRYLVKYTHDNSEWIVDDRRLSLPTPVKLKFTNVHTGEVKKYPTFAAAKADLKIDHKAVFIRLDGKLNKPYKNTWNIERDTDVAA